MEDKNQCYTINEVCRLLKISRFLLTEWRKKGTIKTVEIGGRVLIRREELERLLKENEK